MPSVTSLAETRQLLGAWLTAVADVVRGVNAAEPLEVLLSRIAEQACRLVGFDFCAVMLVDPSGDWLQTRGSHGLSAEYVALLNREHLVVVDPADTVAAHAFRGAVTLAVPDILREREYAATRRLAVDQGFRALLAVPLAASTAPRGVVVAYSTAAREFGPAEVELVELLAQHATLALETAELRAAQERTIAELSAKREVLEWAEAQHRRLMQLLLNEAGLQPLAELLAEALNASITIEDVDDTALAVAPAEPHTPVPDAATRKRRPVRPALESLRARYEVVPIRRCGPDGLPAWVAPVVIGGQLVGRLWGTGASAVPDPAQRRMIERFALVVAVELLKQRNRVDTENRLAGDLVDELLRAGASRSDIVLERAAALGHDLGGPQVLAVVAVDGGGGDAGRLADVIRATASRPLVGTRDGLLVLILPAEPDPTPALTRVHELLATRADAPRVATVVGPPVSGHEFAEAFSVAAAAVELCPHGGTAGVLDLRQLGLAAYLLRAGTTAALRSFADTLVRPLEEYDARKKAQLCATVRTWLDVGASVPAAAKALIVHPNTVAYRLTRAEQLLGRDLRTTATRMELQLAFTVRDVQCARGPA
jgi:sugar diacid utilization regulator